MNPVSPTGAQHELRHGRQRAVVTELGGGLRMYEVDGRPVLDGYPIEQTPASGRGQVLVPWPNRVDGGRYEHDGAALQLPLTEVAKGNASHGLLRWATWVLTREDDATVSARATIWPQPGYPFLVHVRVVWALDDDGLRVTSTLHSGGAAAAPVGLGFHPYVAIDAPRVDDVRLTLPARRWSEVDDRGIPRSSHDVDGTDRDFRAGRLVGGTVLDTPFGDLLRDDDGRWRVRVGRPSGEEVVVWGDATFTHLQVFTADRWSGGEPRSAIAVEPMTCAPDAFNSGDGLVVLAPGERLTGTWGVRPPAT